MPSRPSPPHPLPILLLLPALAACAAWGCGEEKTYTAGLVQGARAAEMQDTRQKLDQIGAVFDRYALDHSVYPQASSIQEAEGALAPAYTRTLPRNDGWGRPLRLTSSPDNFVITSDGQDAAPGTSDDLRREAGGRVTGPAS
jgi:hypothetical protein